MTPINEIINQRSIVYLKQSLALYQTMLDCLTDLYPELYDNESISHLYDDITALIIKIDLIDIERKDNV